MATIDQLTISFLDMPEKDAYNLVRNLREIRRAKPQAARTHKKNVKGTRSADAIIKGKAPKVGIDTLMKTLTPAQKQALLKEMGIDV